MDAHKAMDIVRRALEDRLGWSIALNDDPREALQECERRLESARLND
jgi:hypothetical protein